jgi:hypothetical protein
MNLMEIVGDAGAPVSADNLIKAYLEGLTHTVTLVSDETAENISGFDGIVITESISAATLASKYAGVAIPMVIHEADSTQMTAHKIGTPGASQTTDNFTIVGNTHAIYNGPYATFGAGAITHLLSAVASGTGSVGSPGTGADGLAHMPGNSAANVVVAYDTGAALSDGSAAPARRVFYGIRTPGVPQLTTDGENLLKNIYSWAFPVVPGTTVTKEVRIFR